MSEAKDSFAFSFCDVAQQADFSWCMALENILHVRLFLGDITYVFLGYGEMLCYLSKTFKGKGDVVIEVEQGSHFLVV